MQNYFKYTAIWVALILSMTACKKDFMERYPLDVLSSETYWKSASDLESFNNSIYDLAMQETNNWILLGYNNSGFASFSVSSYALDFGSDNMAPTHSRTVFWQQLRSGKMIIPVNNARGMWYWEFLRACNFFLENYQRANESEEVKNKYAGEVKLFRALFYHDKVRKYGDVPLITKTLNTSSPELYAGRDPRNLVMDTVLADLNFAIQWLPEEWNGDAPGRLDKWCALFVKARICLFEGTWRKYHGLENADMWLTEAASAAKRIMDEGPFEIYSTGNKDQDYRHMFMQDDLSDNPEMIYWKRYDVSIVATNLSYFDAYNGGGSRDFVDDYLCTDGLPAAQSPLYQGDAVIENTFQNRDPRMRQTLLYPPDQPVVQYGGGDSRPFPLLRGSSGDVSNTGYHIIKIYDAATYNGGVAGGQAAPVYRYAEVLLNYAEAKAELGTLTQEDLDISINQLRDRVEMPHLELANVPVDPRYAADGISPLLVEIRRERRIELFAEGARYFDLMRWKQGKKLEKKTWGMLWDAAAMARFPNATVQSSVDPERGLPYIDVYKGTDFATPVFDETKNYLWPLPTNILSQNPALGQTPGW